MFVLGFSGFQSNAVQIGLDQLLDASSEELSLIVLRLVCVDRVCRSIFTTLITSMVFL